MKKPFMHAADKSILLATVMTGAIACQQGRDFVEAGYYGPELAGRGSTPTAMGGSQGAGTQTGNAPPNTAPTQGGSSQPPPVQGGSPQTPPPQAGSTEPTPAGSASSGSGGAPADVPTTPGMQPGAAGTSGAPVATAGVTAPPMTGTSPCDLSGRWLSTVHYVTDAIGQLQVAHMFVYAEIEQQGDAFMITKGLHCGDDAVGAGDFAATVDFKASWAAAASRVSYVGRKGTSVMSDAGCQIDIEKWYVVRGATLPYYLDPANPLPDADQMATDSTPGWEDWDGDGNPGITGKISGVVAGSVFVAPRQWTTMTGAVPDVSSRFQLKLDWLQEQNVMAYDGTPLLSAEAVRAADPTLHFTQFARLADDQATGDDAAICAAVTELAPTLTPEAAGG
ncbi:MAG: hypothetical protein ABW321_06315 [Polyangiales bacterium]